MKRQTRIFKSLTVVFALATLVVGAHAQNTALRQQQQLQQQQMLRVQTMTQRMVQIQERAQGLVQSLEKTMTQAQPKTQAQVQALKRMGEATAKMAGELKGSLERWREMAQNAELAQDKAMVKDMNQVQNRLEKAANELDEMLRVMERMANRLHSGD